MEEENRKANGSIRRNIMSYKFDNRIIISKKKIIFLLFFESHATTALSYVAREGAFGT